MYPDPKHIRDNRVTIRLNDYEHDLVVALANYRGQQLSTFLRELALKEAEKAALGRNNNTNDNSA